MPAEEDNEEEVSELQGQPAPPFTLGLFGLGQADLASHKGKEIVVLDFWATWCGPCVMALPILTEVTDAYSNKGVVFYAVNERDDAAAVRDFLRSKKLDVTVAMDSAGKVGQLYGVRGIPQTVIIDKAGVVQAVHIGYSPNLKQRLTGELEALLAGKSLVKPKTLSAPMLKGLERAWTFAGQFGGLAVDGAKVYAITPKGHVDVLNATGQAAGEVKLDESPALLRTAKLAAGDAKQLLSFRPWGTELKAFDAQGTRLWTYSGGEGIDDVWSADLTGDGLDEVIIGYNGGTGLHVLNSQGHLLWKSAKLNNVWHVCGGNLHGTGKAEVVSTSAAGDVHVFDADGKKLADVHSDLYANMVRLAPGAPGQAGKIIVGGSAEDREDITALDAEGKKLWTVTASDGKGHIDSACVAASHPWLAVSMRGGKVLVVDTEKGEIIGQALLGEAPRGEVAWMETPEGALLVVTWKGRRPRLPRGRKSKGRGRKAARAVILQRVVPQFIAGPCAFALCTG